MHPRNVRRGVQDRTKLEEAKDSGYVKCTQKRYRNKIPDKAWAVLDEFLHSDIASRQDNYRKRKVCRTNTIDNALTIHLNLTLNPNISGDAVTTSRPQHWSNRVLRSLAEGAQVKLADSVGLADWKRSPWRPCRRLGAVIVVEADRQTDYIRQNTKWGQGIAANAIEESLQVPCARVHFSMLVPSLYYIFGKFRPSTSCFTFWLEESG